VVATPVSMEGIEAQAGRHFLPAGEPAEFAAGVIRLLQHPEEARALGERARELVLARYSWASRGAALRERLASLTDGDGVSRPH